LIQASLARRGAFYTAYLALKRRAKFRCRYHGIEAAVVTSFKPKTTHYGEKTVKEIKAMSLNAKNVVAGTLSKPVRNHYFFGKKLDVHHFELEQNYFNYKRWLLNRLVTGVGVVCGLNVKWADPHKRHAVIVKPGLAIDKWGREIVLVNDSKPVEVKPPEAGMCREGEELFVYICLEYLECESDPVAALTGECGDERCMPDTIHERYKITVKPGRAPEIGRRCRIPDLINNNNGGVDYDVMVDWVSEACPAPPADPCIPLAEIEFDEDGRPCGKPNIAVRPIVYTNDLLYELILALTEPAFSPQRGGKY
jgi:hypothetical protein